MIRAHLAFDERLRQGGHYIEAGALELEDAATLVRVREGRRSATDGPFAETKEHLGGFYVIEARDREEAIRLAADCPAARTGWMEVRPFRDLLPELQEGDPIRLGSPRIVEVGPMLLAGPRRDFTPSTMGELPGTWQAFTRRLDTVDLSGVGGRIAYGAGFHFFDDAPGMQYMCAVQVRDFSGVPQDWTRLEIPARRYAIFPHDEHVSRMGETIDTIHQSWAPVTGHLHAPGGGLPDFLEFYGERFDPVSGKGDLEIWYPVRT